MSQEPATLTATIELPITVNVDGGIQDPALYLREWVKNCEFQDLESITDGVATVSNIVVHFR